MGKQVHKTARALEDLLDITDHIAADSEFAAHRFVAAVQSVFDTIGQFPGLGSPREIGTTRSGRIRMVLVDGFAYAVFYQEQADSLLVLRVLSTHRDVQMIFSDRVRERGAVYDATPLRRVA